MVTAKERDYDRLMELVLSYGWCKQEAGREGHDWTPEMGERYTALEDAIVGILNGRELARDKAVLWRGNALTIETAFPWEL